MPEQGGETPATESPFDRVGTEDYAIALTRGIFWESPDIIFRKAPVLIFCGGDFWHGRNFAYRREKLACPGESEVEMSGIPRSRNPCAREGEFRS